MRDLREGMIIYIHVTYVFKIRKMTSRDLSTRARVPAAVHSSCSDLSSLSDVFTLIAFDCCHDAVVKSISISHRQ